MEIPPIENSQPLPNSADDVAFHDHDNIAPQLSGANGGGESEYKLCTEEVKRVLGIIASTGKFWHDWDELKSMLLFQLKQVLSEYPEATMIDNQQNSSLGESYPQLVKRFEEALFSFIEGPPFTLQRLCEILLNAETIYPNLLKLALALEKNLLVTSTLTKSTDPYPPSTMQLPDAPIDQFQDVQPQSELQSPPPHSNLVENGQQLMLGDRDEVTSEVDAEVDNGGMTIDMETFEEIISSSDTNSQQCNSS